MIDMQKIEIPYEFEQSPFPEKITEIEKVVKVFSAEDMSMILTSVDANKRESETTKVTVDVFKNIGKIIVNLKRELEFQDLIISFTKTFSAVDEKQTKKSIENAAKRWREALKKANGDVQKARAIYDQL